MAETDRLEVAIKAVNEASKALREVQKDLAGVESAGKKGSSGLQQFGQAMKSGIHVMADASKALIGFGIAVDQIFELGKAGAQIEFTKQKFDRLAVSIGTTGVALEKDLSRATKGMLSDFQLVESASNLMALGLVKDHDAAVRLTRVASAMNMNMNQLVLTLTNMTTMRFDALGVSVDGFKEKVKALEKQGRSAEEAFREAFLQQAEAQLEKVGDVADTTVGKFARMEAATANLADAFKEKLAPFIGQAADAITTLLSWGDKLNTTFNTHVEEMIVLLREGKKTQEEFDAEMLRAAGVIGEVNFVYDDWGNVIETRLNPAIREQIRLALASADSYRDMGGRMLDAQRASEELKKPMDEVVFTEEELAKQAEEATRKLAEEEESLHKTREASAGAAEGFFGLAQAYADGITKLDQVKAAISGLSEAQKAGTITDFERRQAEETLLLQFGLVTEASLSQAKAQEELNKLMLLGKIDTDIYTNAMLLIPGAAKDGEVTMGELGGAVALAAGQMNDAAQRAEQLRRGIEGIPKDTTVTVTTIYNQIVNAIQQTAGTTPGGGRQFGGPVQAGVPVQVHPPEMFFPSESGFIMSQADTRRMLALLETIAGGIGGLSDVGGVNVKVGTGLLDQAIEVALGKRARAARQTGIGRAIT